MAFIKTYSITKYSQSPKWQGSPTYSTVLLPKTCNCRQYNWQKGKVYWNLFMANYACSYVCMAADFNHFSNPCIRHCWIFFSITDMYLIRQGRQISPISWLIPGIVVLWVNIGATVLGRHNLAGGYQFYPISLFLWCLENTSGWLSQVLHSDVGIKREKQCLCYKLPTAPETITSAILY